MRATSQAVATLGVIALLLGPAPAAPAHAQATESVAAIVNDDVISTYDVRQRMRLILATTGVRPDRELLVRVQEQALNSLIDERLQLQQAEEYEVDIPQEEIDNAMADLAQQNDVSPDEIRSSLASAGVDVRTLEDQLRAEIAWQILVSSRYRQRVRVSNDQIDQALERRAESASKPQFLIAEILIAPEIGESEADLDSRAETVRQQLEQGANFPSLARQVSAAASAIDGGDVSWVRASELKPEIERELVNMTPGELSPPIRTQDGLYLILLRDVRTGSDPERVTLQQVLLPAEPGAGPDDIAELERTLNRAKRNVQGCDQLGRIAGRASGAVVTDLGSIAPSDLAPTFRGIVDAMQPGDISAPIAGQGGVVAIALCSRDRTAGADLPSRDQIEAQLLDQQLSLAARRWLRDLRRDATIETRVGP